MPYLLKTEPSVYSMDDLARDGETIWDGVTAPAAVKFLRGMQRGEMLVIYHTGEEKSTAPHGGGKTTRAKERPGHQLPLSAAADAGAMLNTSCACSAASTFW